MGGGAADKNATQSHKKRSFGHYSSNNSECLGKPALCTKLNFFKILFFKITDKVKYPDVQVLEQKGGPAGECHV